MKLLEMLQVARITGKCQGRRAQHRCCHLCDSAAKPTINHIVEHDCHSQRIMRSDESPGNNHQRLKSNDAQTKNNVQMEYKTEDFLNSMFMTSFCYENHMPRVEFEQDCLFGTVERSAARCRGRYLKNQLAEGQKRLSSIRTERRRMDAWFNGL